MDKMRNKDLNHDQEKLKETIPTLLDCIFFFTWNNVTMVKRGLCKSSFIKIWNWIEKWEEPRLEQDGL